MYDAIKGYENVRTIRLDSDSSELIDHSIAVSTATGTVGWESLFRNKPVLMFGDFFYKKSPGVYRINDIDQCKKALQEILDSKYEFPKDGHKNFIEKLLDSSFYGYVDPAYKDHQSLSEPDNCEVLNSIISSRLRES